MKTSTYYINLIKNKGNALGNLEEFLKQDNGVGFGKVTRLVEKNPQLKEEIHAKLFSTQIVNSYPYHLEFLSLEKILLWNCNLINTYSSYITKFSEKKDAFEKLFLSAKYDEAYEICEKIREEYGCSMWLLDAYGLLETFSNSEYSFKDHFDERTLNYYSILLLKNKKTERQTQYVNRINHLLSKIREPFLSYYKYKLFSEMPFNTSEVDYKWRNILWIESGHSLIDIYLVTIDCLQYYTKHPEKNKLSLFANCIDVISKVDTPYCQMTSSLFSNAQTTYDDTLSAFDYIQLIKNEEYAKIVDLFIEQGLGGDNGFNVCRYAAIAALHKDDALEITQNSLTEEILVYTYNILGKNNEEAVHESVSKLASLSRILRSFSIHKGMCVFLDTEVNIGMNYHFVQQVCTYSDDILLSFEFDNDILTLLPYRALCSFDDSNKIISLLGECKVANNKPLTKNYYETAVVKSTVDALIAEEKYLESISLFIHSYFKNPFLIYCIDVAKIKEYLDEKIKKEEYMTLEELCYVFIDTDYKDFRTSCLLNFLDGEMLDEPLEILEGEKYYQDCVFYFLSRICSLEILISLYVLFNSTEEAEDYRVEICKVLSNNSNQYSRESKTEMEELTKNKALQQRLVNVDRSRVSIDTSDIQEDVFEDIEYQMGICNAQISKNISSQTEDAFFIINPKTDAYLGMYETYAKVFCFSQSGLDTSLSTRVRHGAFENQIFRTFTENSLIYNDGNNALFEPLFEKGKIPDEMKQILHSFHNDVQNKLQYFRQHTLKVFMDEPIEGAVFDYSVKKFEEEGLDFELFFSSLTGALSNANDAIKMLHKLLIEKTTQYLEIIRTTHLTALEKDLIDILDDFSKNCYRCVKDSTAKREIQRNITQCKTALQSEFKTVAGWFYLSEYEEWENYSFSELLNICVEITKKLFVGFGKVRINSEIDDNLIYSGKTFRCNTDILSILLNNAFLHSGFQECPENLSITCELKADSDDIFFEVENNLNDSIDIEQLSNKIAQINEAYKSGVYTSLNTRQEGGMGLYKIMLILHKNLNVRDAFYISLNDHKVKVRIKLPKEFICHEKNSIS